MTKIRGYRPTYKEVLESLGAVSEIDYNKALKKIEQFEQQKQKVITLIKDGRFIEALNVLDPKGEK